MTATRIFARGFPRTTEPSRQYLVYSMHLAANEEVAMILPLPVAAEDRPSALRFISLEGYANFFKALSSGFPPLVELHRGGDPLAAAVPAPLVVEEVGSFRASFVPTVADFARLDAQFCLPSETWEKLPQYGGFGFAVFQLRPGAKTIHPMAFSFARANPRELFFPTVHIHDGEVHAAAEFDHLLYAQKGPGENRALREWQESARPAKSFIAASRTMGIVEPEEHCYRTALRGKLKNQDLRLVA